MLQKIGQSTLNISHGMGAYNCWQKGFQKKDKVQATISIRVSGNQLILISETNKFGQKD